MSHKSHKVTSLYTPFDCHKMATRCHTQKLTRQGTGLLGPFAESLFGMAARGVVKSRGVCWPGPQRDAKKAASRKKDMRRTGLV